MLRDKWFIWGIRSSTCHKTCQNLSDTTGVSREQEELSNFIEGVNPYVGFTDAQLSIILEEVRNKAAT